MSLAPRFGVALPQSYATEPDAPARLREFIGRVEQGGFDSIWVQEQLLGRDPSLEPLLSLAFAAAASTSVRLGTATVVGPLRDPILLAKQIATLDRLSGGRLVLGLSIGEVKSIYGAVGVPLAERGSRLDEALDVLVALWSQPAVRHEGAHWSLDQADMEPKPLQRPHPPLWFGGRSKVALRRAVARGSGWIGAGGASIEAFAEGATWLTGELGRQGRDRNDFTVAKKLYVSVDEDGERARRGLEEWFAIHWPPSFDPVRMAGEVGVAGDAPLLEDALRRTVEAGADLIILNPVFDEGKQLDRLLEVIHGVQAGLSQAPR